MGNFLFIEPFYGGSHKYFLDGLIEYSSHTIEKLTLPARFWKWRMRGAALYLASIDFDYKQFDGIITSNMLSLSDFKALAGPRLPPIMIYFHENQILYPLKEGEEEDLHYGFTDITSALAADTILFNSHYHKDVFIDSLIPFLKRFPDFIPQISLEKIHRKSQVLYPGCHIGTTEQEPKVYSGIPLIIWNHRWEHDKNPEDFFSILYRLKKDEIPFKLALLGEKFSHSPEIFSLAEKNLKQHIIQFGYLESIDDYKNMLAIGDIVISTAIQENYGISIIEAIDAGNFPLLPDRLSYREIIPQSYHKLCIYKNQNDLYKKIMKLISSYDTSIMDKLRKSNLRFSWSSLIEKYDRLLEKKIPPKRDFN